MKFVKYVIQYPYLCEEEQGFTQSCDTFVIKKIFMEYIKLVSPYMYTAQGNFCSTPTIL